MGEVALRRITKERYFCMYDMAAQFSWEGKQNKTVLSTSDRQRLDCFQSRRASETRLIDDKVNVNKALGINA